MVKNYLILLLCLLISCIIPLKSFSQATCTSCLGTGTPNGLYWCVTTATQLYEALVTGNGTAPPIQPGGTVDICGTINLGEINPVLQPFPWDIPAGVTLQGNYDYVTGTRILFPYLYKGGVVCADQLRITPGGEVVEQTLPANEDDGIDMILAAPNRIAYVFTLNEGSQFNNICLQGPKTDLKEQFMYFKMLPLMDQHCAYYPELFNVKEGLSGGLFLNCANCSVNNSEVYGFSLYNVQAVPPASLTGMAEINNSYIHNSKLWGYGYGLFGSGGGGANCSIPLHPCTGPWGGIANINTKNAPPQTIKISKSIFTENGKDLDAAGNGYNFDVTENTMGLRVGAAIVNQHFANFGNSGLNAQTCNIAPNPLAPCLFYPAYGLDDCCNPVISHISGEWINFVNNYLLSGSGEFDLGYPNTWTPDDATCTFPSNTRASGINIENNWFLGETASIWNRIRICDTDHLYWMKEHFAPYGGPFNTALVPPNPTHNPPQYVPLNFYQLYTDIIAGMPQVKIGAKLPSIAHQNPTSVHSILAGDVIEFNTEQCLDASGNLSSANNMWFMWRLNKLSNNLDDETRTGHVSISAPLKVPFEEIGITSIDLIGVDKRDNKASYIATHKVTVRPADYNYHIVFHIKDSYDGPWLRNPGNCSLTKKTMILPPGVPDPSTGSCNGFCQGDNVTHTSTGFVKYLKVNGKILWQQDIGEDDGGWQRIEYPLPGQRPLADYLCTDDGKADAIHGGCVSIVNDKIELGVMAVNDVNSVLVRGLNLFIANVYLNSGHNYLNNWDDDNENILKNGDFAEHNGSHVALVWDRINNAPLSYSAACYSPGMSFNSNKDWEVQSHEVRSGIFSNGVRIRALTPDNDRMIPGMVYPVLTGHGNAIIPYHAITQEFNLQAKLPPSNYRFIQPSIDFTIKPNPSALGTTLTGSIQNLPADQSYQVSIYTPEGTLAYLGNGYTSEFTISKTLPAGVYYVKVWGKGFSSYKRIVVVG